MKKSNKIPKSHRRKIDKKTTKRIIKLNRILLLLLSIAIIVPYTVGLLPAYKVSILLLFFFAFIAFGLAYRKYTTLNLIEENKLKNINIVFPFFVIAMSCLVIGDHRGEVLGTPYKTAIVGTMALLSFIFTLYLDSGKNNPLISRFISSAFFVLLGVITFYSSYHAVVFSFDQKNTEMYPVKIIDKRISKNDDYYDFYVTVAPFGTFRNSFEFEVNESFYEAYLIDSYAFATYHTGLLGARMVEIHD